MRTTARKTDAKLPRVPAGLPHCPHRPPCAACPRFGASGIASAAQAALAGLARTHGLEEPAVINGQIGGFRLRARLAIRGRVGSPKLGLFEPGTHRVVHIPNCSVQHPLINRVAAVVRRALAETKVTSYSDQAHLGVARYLQVVVERRSQSAQVVLVGNSATTAPLGGALELIRERLDTQLHSLWFSAQCDRSNTILGPALEHCWGAPCVIEHFGEAAIHYPPGAFGQSNLEIASAIIDHVRDEVPAGARIAEFYAGVGAIGLSILEGAAALRVNESSPHSLHGLERGLAGLAPAARAKVTVFPGPADEAAEAAAGVDVVIVDPPRKGLDAALLQTLCAQPPARLIYVGCGLDSLVRDAALLTANGRLRLTRLTAFNLMPFTEHVETVARFEAG